MGELMDLDRMPRLRWISNPFRRSVFETREEAETKIRASFQRGLTARQEEKLSDYLREHLVQAERSGRPVWKVDLERSRRSPSSAGISADTETAKIVFGTTYAAQRRCSENDFFLWFL
jgi:hypothetical protein